MAKTLPHEEEEAYRQALLETNPAPTTPGEAFTRALSARRDSALELAPELRAFFNREFPQMFPDRQ
jgi:hypothetical protein